MGGEMKPGVSSESGARVPNATPRQHSGDIKRRVLELRRSHTLRQVAALTGLPLGTVKTLCSRSGAFRDNSQHRAMFTLPPITLSALTALAVPELPPQQVVTGDMEVDAVLWLHSVIQTGQAALIEKALVAAKRIKTPLDVLEKRYRDYLVRAHPGNLFAALSSFGFSDLDRMAERAVEKLTRQQEAHARFGAAIFEETPAERFCTEALAGVRTNKEGWCLEMKQVDSRFDSHPALRPHTLTDCIHELTFWRELYCLRNSFDGGCDHSMQAQARDDYAFRQLAAIRPRSAQEAVAVFRYLADNDRMNLEETNKILLNLIGDR